MIEKLLSLNPMRVTPELAALRDSLIEDKLEASCEALDRLLENN